MQEDLEWKVVVKDEASATLKKVTEATKDLSESTDKLSSTTKGSKSAWQDTAKGVFTGVAAYDAAKIAIKATVGFLKESALASMDAAAEMEIVRQNVENSGVSYESVKGKLDAYSQSMVQMGFDDEATASSVSKLMLVTGDYEKALKMNHLAMDLARNKNIDLATSTRLVTLVSQGNNKALKEYGIELDDSASAADNLSKLQDKVRGSTEAFGETTKGQLEVVKTEWGNVKEKIGDELAPVLGAVLEYMKENLPKIAGAVSTIAGAFAQVSDAIRTAGALLNGFDKKLGEITGQQKGKGLFQSFFGDMGTSIKYTVQGLKQGVKDMTDVWGGWIYEASKLVDVDLAGNLNQTSSAAKGAAGDIKATADATKDLNKEGDKIKNPFEGIGVGAKNTGASLKESLSKIKEDYKSTVTDAIENLAKLEEAHSDNTKNIKAKIEDLKNSLKELQTAYDQSIGEMNRTEAEKVAEQEKIIKDLKDQLAQERASQNPDQTRISDIEKQLAKEEAAYTAYISKRTGLEAELTEARRRASLTEFERAIEDINIRRKTEEDAHTKKMGELNASLAAEQTNLTQENVIYAAKRAQYLETEQAFKDFSDKYKLNLASMNKATQKEVDAMNAKLKELTAILKSIETAKNKAGILGAMETVQQQEQASSGTGTNTSGGVTVNLGGVTITNEADEDRLVQKIIRQLQLSQLGSQ